MTSPMQKTLEQIKRVGHPYWIVETFNHWSKKRNDLFGIIDLLVLNNGVLGIQVCRGDDYRAHIRKLTDQEKKNTTAWLEQPGTRLQIWAWRKLKQKRGGKRMVWKPKIADILIEDDVLAISERENG